MFSRKEKRDTERKEKKKEGNKPTLLISQVHVNPSKSTSTSLHFINMNGTGFDTY